MPLMLLPVFLDFFHMGLTKNTAFAEALRLSNGKGIINIGSGTHRTQWAHDIAENPKILANIDIVPDGAPNFLQMNVAVEPLPFGDKQFGCAFASHVLEHLDNWEFALNEMVRVADRVVVVLPHPAYFSGWICPEHKQHFSIEDAQDIAQLYPNVKVYC